MHITLIYPSVERRPGKQYIRTWQMEPLTIAQVYSQIPPDIDVSFFDDRLEDIDFAIDTDAVLISMETYTANRAYHIAGQFRKRNIPVICGGYHPTLMPDEAAGFCDSIILGEAEPIINQLIEDIRNNTVKQTYGPGQCTMNDIMPDRSILSGKGYMPVSLVETSRGCPFACDFCSISAFYKQHYKIRPIDSVIKDIKSCGNSNLFLVDDNLIADKERSKELFRRMASLNIRWAGQGSLHMAEDRSLLKLMKQSGCSLILIGFESLSNENLSKMKKSWNVSLGDYNELIKRIHDAGIGIYATFVFGYGDDSEETFQKTYEFAMRNKFLFAAFNHLAPFPGTDVYKRLEKEGRLIYSKWWRNPAYSYGDIAFRPIDASPEEIRDRCIKYRRKFFSIPSIIKRAANYRANIQNPYFATLYFGQSFLARREIDMKLNLHIGKSN
ncbi:MAG: radical SAM protein [bacterium]